jgi:hypothetical protein
MPIFCLVAPGNTRRSGAAVVGQASRLHVEHEPFGNGHAAAGSAGLPVADTEARAGPVNVAPAGSA